MKKFIYNIVIFVLICLVGASVLQWIVDFGLKRMTTYTSTQTSIPELLSDTLNADIVIMGNSRALCSYNPQIIESITHKRVWNIGVSGQPFGISYLRYQLYRKNNKVPCLLIINIDNNELSMISNGFGREEYYPYLSNDNIRSYFNLYGFSWKHLYIPMYKYFGDYKLIGYGLMSAMGIYPFKPCHHYHGYSNANTDFDGEPLRERISKNEIADSECEPEAVQLLEQLLKETKMQGIQVAFCYAPQYQPLYSRLHLEKTMNVYNVLSETYNVPIYDYSSLEWTNDSLFFYNANHVNLLGAELFTTKLVQDVKSILNYDTKKEL